MPPLPHIITRPEDLAALASRMRDEPALGLDTEFMRERTYRAELCLVQVSGAAFAACIDPLALADLSVLGALVAPPLEKVLHAARQDLEVLAPALGPLAPVFDTQIAAALAGQPAQIGYAELVRRLLGVELHKAHTRADWSRRPLSAEQIEYALDDVRYLLPLRERLLEEIGRLGRRRWLDEELAGLAMPEALGVEPEEAWRRVRSLQGLGPERAGLVRALAAWRERRAIEKNRPRGWILDDTLMREVAVRAPRSETALEAIPEMPAAIVRNCGAELLALVEASGLPDPPPPLPRRERPDGEQLTRLKRLSAVLQQVARELGVSAEILATRRDLERLAEGAEGSRLLEGWRREVIGERLVVAL